MCDGGHFGKRPFSRLCYKFWNSTQEIIESSGILYLNQLSKSMPSEMYTGLNGRARTIWKDEKSDKNVIIILTKGSKFQLEQNCNSIMNAVEDYSRKWAKKEGVNDGAFSFSADMQYLVNPGQIATVFISA